MHSTPAAVEIHLRLRLRGGCYDAYMAFLEDGIPYYESPGGIRVRLLRDHADPERYIEVIEYGSQEIYEIDQQRVEHDQTMKAFLDRWRGLLAEPPVVEVYHNATPSSTEPR